MFLSGSSSKLSRVLCISNRGSISFFQSSYYTNVSHPLWKIKIATTNWKRLDHNFNRVFRFQCRQVCFDDINTLSFSSDRRRNTAYFKFNISSFEVNIGKLRGEKTCSTFLSKIRVSKICFPQFFPLTRSLSDKEASNNIARFPISAPRLALYNNERGTVSTVFRLLPGKHGGAKESRELGEFASFRESWREIKIYIGSNARIERLEFERFHFGNERVFSILSTGWEGIIIISHPRQLRRENW